MPFQYDVFICHASEDKEAVARPLHDILVEDGLAVFLDEYQLTVGDSLRREIDKALLESEYAVVILSAVFFTKEFAQSELDGLFMLQKANKKRILPFVHGITVEEVSTKYSPLMGGKLMGTTEKGVIRVRDEILRAIKPDIAPPIPVSKRQYGNYPPLSDQAIQILMAARVGDGVLHISETDQGGYLARAGGKAFCHQGDDWHRKTAELREDVRSLITSGYFDHLAKTTFRLSTKGYAAYDALK